MTAFDANDDDMMNEKGGKIHDEAGKEELTGSEKMTWQEISKTFDRKCFYIYTMFILILTVIFIGALNGSM